MTLALVMTLLALGVAWSQAVSSHHAVTLRWLRLGDLIGMAVLTIAGTILVIERQTLPAAGFRTVIALVGFLYAAFVVHIILVQLGRRGLQRALIVVACMTVAAVSIFGSLVPGDSTAFPIALQITDTDSTSAGWSDIGPFQLIMIGVSQVLSSFLLGGSLMTMLLGHAYLTAGGEMTQQPFLRLTALLLIVIASRAVVAAAAGALPWWLATSTDNEAAPMLWIGMLVATRFVVGLLVPLIMSWMAYQCVRIRSNQSATGILYVSSLMLLIGEITAMSLWSETHLAF